MIEKNAVVFEASAAFDHACEVVGNVLQLYGAFRTVTDLQVGPTAPMVLFGKQFKMVENQSDCSSGMIILGGYRFARR